MNPEYIRYVISFLNFSVDELAEFIEEEYGYSSYDAETVCDEILEQLEEFA